MDFPAHRVCLWSGPRNVSTALMYSFRQRRDTRVVDEPLYGHYLRVTGAPHPAPEAVLAALDTDGERVVREVVLGPCDRPVLFMKHMAHHLIDLDLGFLDETVNVLLIRDPRDMLPSLAKQLPEPTLRDTGLARQVALLDDLLARGQDPPVLDARELLLDPPGVLRQLCRRIGLPFDEAMLRWPAGPKPEDGVWAPYWYESVHRSTGWQPYRPKTAPLSEHLRPLLEACRPYYERLYARALRRTTEEEQRSA
ncbi:sulfotransferase family protein [Rhodothermaceae bacterium RA]|nr:sulfotransferase family protein [Rhodothermaceae bacterium RA]